MCLLSFLGGLTEYRSFRQRVSSSTTSCQLMKLIRQRRMSVRQRLYASYFGSQHPKYFFVGSAVDERTRNKLPALHLIYQARIQPHFDCCNIVWGNCGITLQNKIQKPENRAAHVLTNSNYDADAGHLFELLGWKNLASQQHIQRATMVYKSLHGLAPDYLCSKFERRETAYNLRDSENKLNVPLPRTNYYKNYYKNSFS